jgi:hypothetical protein
MRFSMVLAFHHLHNSTFNPIVFYSNIRLEITRKLSNIVIVKTIGTSYITICLY